MANETGLSLNFLTPAKADIFDARKLTTLSRYVLIAHTQHLRLQAYPYPAILQPLRIKMSSDEHGGESPPRFGRIPRLRGFLPLSDDINPMATHGQGVLGALIRTQSSTSLQGHRMSVVWNRSTPDDEDSGPRRLSQDGDIEDFRRGDDRHLSSVLFGPQMRSQRLIGNSNPRYRWEKYWKTEEELKTFRKPMFVHLCASSSRSSY